ncbi:hypothetical protein [Nocardia arizonensis]|uniref:hypothetical protein n=1 Tax=Nocardia arizonensis TaxID=1141647 RepID=UPI0006D1E7DA|nr:hypothetical protein [Nocardia arizonensis]
MTRRERSTADPGCDLTEMAPSPHHADAVTPTVERPLPHGPALYDFAALARNTRLRGGARPPAPRTAVADSEVSR